MKVYTLAFLIVSIVFVKCSKRPNEELYETDSLSLTTGKKIFKAECSGCHNMRSKGIGPALGNITKDTSRNWIELFIKDPSALKSAGDRRASRLFKRYNIPMPAFPQIAAPDMDALLSYLHASEYIAVPDDTTGAIADPIPEAIKKSDLVLPLHLITQIPRSSQKPPFTRITSLTQQPGNDDLFVLDLRGKLYRLSGGKPTVYFDLPQRVPSFIDQPGLATGFGGVAFHPEFQSNGLMYTSHTEPPPAQGKSIEFDIPDSVKSTLQWVITEWKATNPSAESFSGTRRELFRIGMVTGIHGVQEIAFNPSVNRDDNDYGMLYIGIGDGGAAENGLDFLVHSPRMPWGTIFRIDPAGNNSNNRAYGIPQDNPFATSKDGTVKEIYAYGFRNPHRFTWDKKGQMLTVNIGDSHIEAIDIIQPGADYGWPLREGPFMLHSKGDLSKAYPLPATDSDMKITYPVAMYDHSEGKAISGGYVYEGKNKAMQGKFFFGDIPIGRLFFTKAAALRHGDQATIMEWRVSLDSRISSLSEICGSKRVDLHFGHDVKGNLYILTKADGKLYKLGD